MYQKEKIKNIFGISGFRASQEKIIDDVISGKNCLVIMPTGRGKSICCQFPALVLDGLTIVISPLIALLQDQVQKLKKLGIDADFINSSLSKDERITQFSRDYCVDRNSYWRSTERYYKTNWNQ